MIRIALCAMVIAAPLGAQSTDTSARDSGIAAAALRETPKHFTTTARVTRLAVRGDTAQVTVTFYTDERHARGQHLTIARRDEQWVALPMRSVFIMHFVPKAKP